MRHGRCLAWASAGADNGDVMGEDASPGGGARRGRCE
jgi:hypothetical protein